MYPISQIELSKIYERIFRNSIKSFKGNDSSYKLQVEKLQSFEDVYKIVRAFPVWPFDTKSIGKFTAWISTPIISTLLIKILENILVHK